MSYNAINKMLLIKHLIGGGKRMKEITRIVIKGSSGYCCADEAYEDKLTIENNKISYKYIPVVETEINPKREWSYKTNSPIYKMLFSRLSDAVPNVINLSEEIFCTDIGAIEFQITYLDKSKDKITYFVPGDTFKDFFDVIKKMIPSCEYVPAVILTEDDYEE